MCPVGIGLNPLDDVWFALHWGAMRSCSPAQQRLQRAAGSPETSLPRLNLVKNTKTASFTPLTERLLGDLARGCRGTSSRRGFGQESHSWVSPFHLLQFDLSLCCWVRDAEALQGVFVWKFCLLLYCRGCPTTWKLPWAVTALPFVLCSPLKFGTWTLGNKWEMFYIVAASRSR